MLPSDPAARLPPLDPELFTEETWAFFNQWSGGVTKGANKEPVEPHKNPPLATYAHHPQLAEVFSRFNLHLLTASTLPVKQRQMAIMRAAWLCKATYVWSSHLQTSMIFGLDPAMFGPLQVGASDPYFSTFERSVMKATDELVHNHIVAPDTWDTLMVEWNNQQMLDFLFTVGAYVLAAGVMRSTGVQRDQKLLALAAEYGAP